MTNSEWTSLADQFRQVADGPIGDDFGLENHVDLLGSGSNAVQYRADGNHDCGGRCRVCASVFSIKSIRNFDSWMGAVGVLDSRCRLRDNFRNTSRRWHVICTFESSYWKND